MNDMNINELCVGDVLELENGKLCLIAIGIPGHDHKYTDLATGESHGSFIGIKPLVRELTKECDIRRVIRQTTLLELLTQPRQGVNEVDAIRVAQTMLDKRQAPVFSPTPEIIARHELLIELLDRESLAIAHHLDTTKLKEGTPEVIRMILRRHKTKNHELVMVIEDDLKKWRESHES